MAIHTKRLNNRHRSGGRVAARDMNTIADTLNTMYGVNGCDIRRVGNALRFDCGEAGGGLDTSLFMFGELSIDGPNRKVTINNGRLFHPPIWYIIPETEIIVAGGTEASPQYTIVEYIHRTSAALLPTTQTSFSSTAGVSRFPLGSYFLKDDEIATRVQKAGILHIGVVIFGGPVMP